MKLTQLQKLTAKVILDIDRLTNEDILTTAPNTVVLMSDLHTAAKALYDNVIMDRDEMEQHLLDLNDNVAHVAQVADYMADYNSYSDQHFAGDDLFGLVRDFTTYTKENM